MIHTNSENMGNGENYKQFASYNDLLICLIPFIFSGVILMALPIFSANKATTNLLGYYVLAIFANVITLLKYRFMCNARSSSDFFLTLIAFPVTSAIFCFGFSIYNIVFDGSYTYSLLSICLVSSESLIMFLMFIVALKKRKECGCAK
jgi:cytochrome bd-type quinol oxidase subunit 2